MKRILFNANHAEELRVAIVDGQELIDLDLEPIVRSEKKGNIYKGIVTKVEPSLEAAFVDYGAKKQGFLPLKEIYRGHFSNHDESIGMTNVRIENVIQAGQEMIVQVDKDERGTKGAALTTFVSLAGQFLVLMPNNPKGGGISRRISGEERAELRQIIANLELRSEHALIARTAGIGCSEQELQWDLDFLNKLWNTIDQASKDQKAPFLIYQESNLIVRCIRDHLTAEVAELIIDDDKIFERAQRLMQKVMPQHLGKLKLYQDNIPLFSRYQITQQTEAAFNREVRLPSGGAIIIDHTEALISIDVNSARATKGSDIEDTALQTNLEAVDEITRQLRIRDLGGLVVIDLIDMAVNNNRRAVETRIKEASRPDRARVQVGKISRFGLLEMSRQRLRSSLSDSSYRTCPRCAGIGSIRSVVSSTLNLLRLIEEEALKENTDAIQVLLPLDMATYLLNEKRPELAQLETRLASRIIIIPTSELVSPNFHVQRLRGEELERLVKTPSYQQEVEHNHPVENPLDLLKSAEMKQPKIRLEYVDHTAPPVPVPSIAKEPRVNMPVPPQRGLLRRLFGNLGGFHRDNAPHSAHPQSPVQSSADSGTRYDNRRGGRSPSGNNKYANPPARRGRQRQNTARPDNKRRGRSPNERMPGERMPGTQEASSANRSEARKSPNRAPMRPRDNHASSHSHEPNRRQSNSGNRLYPRD